MFRDAVFASVLLFITEYMFSSVVYLHLFSSDFVFRAAVMSAMMFLTDCVFSGQVKPQRAMFVADYMFNGAVCPPLYLSLILCLAVQLSTMIFVTDLVFSRVMCLQQFWSLLLGALCPQNLLHSHCV